MLRLGGDAVCLIKPQFEAGREKVGKKGVVRDFETHRQVVGKVVLAAEALGFAAQGAAPSPIRGPQGNIEYLLHLKNDAGEVGSADRLAQTAVAAAEREFAEEP